MRDAKVRSLRELLPLRRALARGGRTVVLTNGCFDLLHAGHVRLLRRARAEGDVLVVALNTDASVRRLKGPGRPIFPLRERLEVLAAFADVDYVTWFSEPTPRRIVAALRPDVLVKGGDWPVERIVGREVVQAGGGSVHSLPLLPGYSTTALIERIRSGR